MFMVEKHYVWFKNGFLRQYNISVKIQKNLCTQKDSNYFPYHNFCSSVNSRLTQIILLPITPLSF